VHQVLGQARRGGQRADQQQPSSHEGQAAIRREGSEHVNARQVNQFNVDTEHQQAQQKHHARPHVQWVRTWSHAHPSHQQQGQAVELLQLQC
jgi:hypothetical protein